MIEQAPVQPEDGKLARNLRSMKKSVAAGVAGIYHLITHQSCIMYSGELGLCLCLASVCCAMRFVAYLSQGTN